MRDAAGRDGAQHGGFGVALHGVEHIARKGGGEGARGRGHRLRAQAVQRRFRAQRGDRGIDRGPAGQGGGAAERRDCAAGTELGHRIGLSRRKGDARRRAACHRGRARRRGMREPAGPAPRTTPRDPPGACALRGGVAAQRRCSGAAAGAMGLHRRAAVRRHRRLPRTFRPTLLAGSNKGRVPSLLVAPSGGPRGTCDGVSARDDRARAGNYAADRRISREIVRGFHDPRAYRPEDPTGWPENLRR